MRARSARIGLVVLVAALLAAAGCGQESKDARLLESERRLQGMYEECLTIEVTDSLGEHPPIATEELKGMETVDVDTFLVRSNGMARHGVWTGAKLSDVLAKYGIEGEFSELRFVAYDGYVAKIPREMAMRPDTVIAWQQDGQPLPQEEGPVRLVVGSEDGFYWIHRITGMEIVR